MGDARYQLLKAAFARAQQAIQDGYYPEAITLLESILTDRLGSVVHGSLGKTVTLRHTLHDLIETAISHKPPKVKGGTPRPSALSKGGKKSSLPADVTSFLQDEMRAWWRSRNDAVHGMAKLAGAGDSTFAERYARLEIVALEGIRVLLRLDAFDKREKERNGAGLPATAPYALALETDIEQRLQQIASLRG